MVMNVRRMCLAAMLVCGPFCFGGCIPPIEIPDLSDIIDGGSGLDVLPARIRLDDFATNTGGASGIAINPTDGGLYLVNRTGLFGPIMQGDDVSTLDPIGATNLGDDDIFDAPQDKLVLAISDDGEFWIGSGCCATLARVPAGGGDAVPFLGLLENNATNAVSPEALVFAPDGTMFDDFAPGDLLAGADTTFSTLSAIDPDTGTVSGVGNPSVLNREAHHLAFGPDGTFYGSKAAGTATIAGIQTIAADGSPTGLPGTFRVGADTFVALDNGDLIIVGSFRREGDLPSERFLGVFFWDAGDEAIVEGLELQQGEVSEDAELITAPDGTVFLARPAINEIVTVADIR